MSVKTAAASELDPRLMETQVTCVLTRVELAHFWQAPLLWLHYRRAHRSLPTSSHLIAARLLVESPRVYFTLSIWSRPFGTGAAATAPHVDAARFGYRRCRAVWSTQWHLTRLSPGAQRWPGLAVDWGALAAEGGAMTVPSAPFTFCQGEVLDLRPPHPETVPHSHSHDG